MNRERKRANNCGNFFYRGKYAVSRALASNERAWDALTEIFPEEKATELEAFYSKKGKSKVKMFGRGKRAYELYTVERETNVGRFNPKLPKQIKNSLGTEREVLIAEKYKDIEELNKSIREDETIANDDNEAQEVRERSRERIAEKMKQIDALENERDAHGERLPVRERVKNIFKKYGLTVTAVGPGSGNGHRSDCQLPELSREGSRGWSQESREKDNANSSRSDRDYRRLHRQGRRIDDQLPRKECLASHPRSDGFHG
ncbi:uncharacterized protein LOC110041300 [Orbicella faveolata]|uniref:uncharacterized protein LOC110041300 n=1 Tax=Orbicella faveolata TaxID=48498 RepID=UPI0009E4F546|nr:uncharacterized protein LOC110041300 [Orbicella faveolata]